MNTYQSRKLRASMLAIACTLFVTGADAAVFVDKADVTRVRKVTPPATDKRCWTEWEQSAVDATATAPASASSNGSAFGGFKFVATSGGLAAPSGADASANTGAQAAAKPVEHCVEEPGAAKPAYWEVEYTYRGFPFTTRLNYDPGPTISVRVVVDPQPD